MAVTYGFYNALNHDRLYDAIQMSSIFDGIIRDGIFSTIGDTMIVTAPEDGMYVNVGSGRAWFNHTWTLNDTDYPIEAEQAEVVLDRIDAVILEVNSSAEVRANSIKFLKGTPSSNPVKPTLTHNAEVNQYALAYVRIRAGQTTIFQSDIENAVGTDETPLVTGVLQQVSIETLLKQWEAEFNTYFTNFKNTSTTEFNNWFAAKVSEYTVWFAQMQTDMDSNFNEFDAWFQNIKDQLDENQAGHLQLQIDNLSGRIDDVEAEMPFAGGSKVNINFEYDVIPNIQYSNEHYKLTVGDTVRENNFSSSKLHFDEYGILTVGDGILEVTYDVTDSRTGKITHVSYTYNIKMPYFGRFAYNVTISANIYDYQGWLESIGKDASKYATIDDVFADEKLLRELMTRHASVDYLVEWLENNNEDAHTVLNNDYCAKWINLRDYALDMLYANTTVKAVMDEVDKYGYGEWALIDGTWQPKGNVPIMTSNTAPYGEASASSVYQSLNAYLTFDGNITDTGWVATANTDCWIQYKFANPIKVNRVSLIPRNSSNNSGIKNFKVQGSNDGNIFEDIYTGQCNGTIDSYQTFTFNNDDYYLYYRIHIVDIYSGAVYCGIQVLQFYGRQLNVSIPTMTSDTAPFGELLHGGEESAEFSVWKAFDKNNSSRASQYPSLDGNSGVGYYGYDFGGDTVVKFVTEYSSNTSELAIGLKYYLEGSSDKNTWTKVREFTSNAQGSNAYSDVNSDNQASRYWRMAAYSGGGNGRARNSTCLFYNELQFYGLDYSEREFAEGSTMKYLYDHGVELEPIDGFSTNSSSAFYTKESNQLYVNKTVNNSISLFNPANGIDISPYKLLRGIAGDKFVYAGGNVDISIRPAHNNTSQTISQNNLSSNFNELPNNIFLDVSHINSVAYPVMSTNDGGTVNSMSLTEWWLE